MNANGNKADKDCRLCKSTDLVPYLDLGYQPPSNSFLHPNEISSEKRFPLVVCLCQSCGLSQLSHDVDHTKIFSEYAYRSSSSRALISSFRDTVQHVNDLTSGISRKIKLIDVGCNDGLLLEQCSSEKFEAIGLEPSEAGKIAIDKGYSVEQRFLTAESGKLTAEKYGSFDVVVVTNVLAHVPDIADFVQGISSLLDMGGFWVVEFPYVHDMLRNLTFDTIYHEHFSYLSISPLVKLFNKFNLWIVNIKTCEVGGSGPFLRLTCVKSSSKDFESRQSVCTENYVTYEQIVGNKELSVYSDFSKRVERHKKVMIEKIDQIISSGELLGGYGAPAKGNTLLNYLNLDASTIKLIADNTSEKIGRVTPGSHIPVVSDEDFSESGIRTALLLSWNYLSFFQENAKFYNSGGRFLVPFLNPRIEVKDKI